MKKDIGSLVLSKAGTFSLQETLKFLDHEDIGEIIGAIYEDLTQICTNEYGTHFIQKLLHFSRNHCLISYLLENMAILGTNKHGIVVLKALLKTNATQEMYRYWILESCQNNFEELAFSEFGHYLIEELFEVYSYYELQNLVAYLVAHGARLSLNQFSSSILRKIIQNYGDYACSPMI